MVKCVDNPANKTNAVISPDRIFIIKNLKEEVT